MSENFTLFKIIQARYRPHLDIVITEVSKHKKTLPGMIKEGATLDII